MSVYVREYYRKMALRGGTIAALDNAVGVSDMCLLPSVDEENFIENLCVRFRHDQIYVSTRLDSGQPKPADI